MSDTLAHILTGEPDWEAYRILLFHVGRPPFPGGFFLCSACGLRIQIPGHSSQSGSSGDGSINNFEVFPDVPDILFQD